MRNWFLAALIAGIVSLSPAARAQEDITVKGEVVDLACYLAKGKKGPEHKACAQMCAKGGVPMGLLTESDELYLLIDDHADPKGYEAAKKLGGSNAEITGKKYIKNGMASIVVKSASGL